MRYTFHMTNTITVDVHAYATLLVKAGVVDEAEWPEALREGAGLLARIRVAEADCAAQHGKWDWGLLSEPEQDEYDSLCAELDRLIEPEIGTEWETLKAARRVELVR